jgi:hypothetical protein
MPVGVLRSPRGGGFPFPPPSCVNLSPWGSEPGAFSVPLGIDGEHMALFLILVLLLLIGIGIFVRRAVFSDNDQRGQRAASAALPIPARGRKLDSI